jgi:hypothetical protein
VRSPDRKFESGDSFQTSRTDDARLDRSAGRTSGGVDLKTTRSRDVEALAAQLRREFTGVPARDVPVAASLGAQLGIRSAARSKGSLSQRLADEVSADRLDNKKVLDLRKRGSAAISEGPVHESLDEQRDLNLRERMRFESDELNAQRSSGESSQLSSEGSQGLRGNIPSYLTADMGRTKVPSGQTMPDSVLEGEGTQLSKQVKDVLVSMRLKRGGGDATFRYETKAGSKVLVRLIVQDDQAKIILTAESGMLESDLQGALSRLAESVERGGLKVSEQKLEYGQADTGGSREWDKDSYSRDEVQKGRKRDDDAEERENTQTSDSETEQLAASVPGRSIHIVV